MDCILPDVWQGNGSSCLPDPCVPTPVLLESCRATSLSEGLRVRWEIPLDASGGLYRVWRDVDARPLDPVPSPEAVPVSPGWISASSGGVVEIVDRGAIREIPVWYFLESDAGGGRFLGSIEARWDPPALAWSVAPNPFRSSVRLTPPDAGAAEAEIFDAAGRFVRHLGPSSGGVPLEWDGLDASGRNVPAGIFLLRMTSGSARDVQRVVKGD